MNHYESATGRLAGAWENVTGSEGGWTLRGPHRGAPVGPLFQESLGARGNLTSVMWRVDGGPVGEVEGVSVRQGELVSPEYIKIRFTASGPDEWQWEMTGVLDTARGEEDLVDVIVSFLERVRGPSDENTGLAERFVPIADFGSHGPQEVRKGEEVDPVPPRSLVLPSEPWVLTDRLEEIAQAVGRESQTGYVKWSHEGWGGSVSLPEARWSNHTDEEEWGVMVDAVDQVHVMHEGHEAMDFLNETYDLFATLGLPAPDLERWERVQQDRWGFLCPPGPGEATD